MKEITVIDKERTNKWDEPKEIEWNNIEGTKKDITNGARNKPNPSLKIAVVSITDFSFLTFGIQYNFNLKILYFINS